MRLIDRLRDSLRANGSDGRGRSGGRGGDALERRTWEIGNELLDRAEAADRGLFSAALPGVWSEKLMDWTLRDAGFKTQLFRFVDVFPALRTPEAVTEHLRDYLSQPGVKLPPGMALGMKAGEWAQGTFVRTVTSQIESMASKFIAGRDARAALPSLRKRWDEGIGFSVDLLGEACVSDAEAEAYRQRYVELIELLGGAVRDWPANERLERTHRGPLSRANVSIKLSSLYARTDPIAFERTRDALVEVLTPILRTAAEQGVFVNFDMEQHALKELTLATFERCSESIEFHGGIAMQAYLRSGDEDARRIIDWSRRPGREVTVRLVKGAYWDYETIHAEMMGWPTPVWSYKGETDACFERMSEAFLRNGRFDASETGGVSLALGSHNARSIAYALAVLEREGLPRNAIELQMLRGMADPLKRAAVEMGLRVREYVPVGELIPGMAYLVRRLLENTSNESWLRAGFAEKVSREELLAAPASSGSGGAEPQASHGLAPDFEGRPFVNEPVRDFADAGQREAFSAAVGRAVVPDVSSARFNASVEEARGAVEGALRASHGWRDVEARERAGMLMRAAAGLRAKRDELAGVIIREAGKPWREADADVCEAIDFLEFYARVAPALFEPVRLGRFVGELNEQWHEPRGVCVVISPWNFPQAIVTGMTAAALVTGNPAIVKPAEQTPGIALRMCEALWEAGVPRDVLQFVPGEGETVGAALVKDPRVALIAFTGSKEVGLQILREAGDTPAGAGHMKKVVCEMGGKNAIIVDTSADLDEAVLGVRGSAFGYAGQKCSACSRVIVLDAVYDAFVARLVESTKALVVGDPLNPATDVGPLIDDEAAAKVRRYIQIGQGEGRLALAMQPTAERALGKPIVGPHIFTGIEQRHRLANEEIFGPVLSVMRARDFDEALAIANASDFKLTGGVFSRRPLHLAQAKREFRVGNLYLNRGITGALVGRQPFGGFGMSGVGTKAGGREYLSHFVVPRVCTENTLRRGFAPGDETGAGALG